MAVSIGILGAVIAVPAEFAGLFADFPQVSAPVAASVSANSSADVLVETTRLAIEHSPLLCMHAGVVSGPDGIVSVPGRSGLGKTTLVAALVRAGFGYVSDEALAIDRSTGDVTAFPRPLSLNSDVWPMFGAHLGEAPAAGTERLVAPACLGTVNATGGRVSDIVLATRPDAPALRPVPRGDAVVALLRHSFNHFADPPASFRAVVNVVRGARVWHAGYTDAAEFADRLSARLADRRIAP